MRAGSLEPGDSLEGGYRIVELLGQGAYGRVYRATDTGLGRDVAVKLLTSAGGSQKQRFLREGQIAAALDHPAIGKVFSTGEHGLHPYLVYELLEGAQDLRSAAKLWDRARRLEAMLDVVDGVAFAHAQGVVHRDLKPDNVIVDAEGRCRVIDFGLAKTSDSERLTLSGAMVGTPLYMAPEGFRGEQLTPAADVWSLGVILYWLLTETHPFEGANLIELGRKVDELPPDSPAAVDPTIPLAVSSACMRALYRRSEERYPDAGAFAEALREALAGRGGGAARARRGGLPAVLGLAAAVAAGLGLGAWLLGGAAPTPAERGLTGAVAADAALGAGELARARELVHALPPSAERALLVARLATADGEDPRPGLREALERWPQAALSRSLAIAELSRGRVLEARRELSGPRLERWPRDAEARSLLQLLEGLRERPFVAGAVDSLRAAAPEAVCAWLEVECARDFELWRWRNDPRFTTRQPQLFAATPELVARLDALSAWGTPRQGAWARACLAMLRPADPPLGTSGDATAEQALVRLVGARQALARGEAQQALALTAGVVPERWRAWRLALRGAALLAVGQREEALSALLASSVESPLEPEVCRLLAEASPAGSSAARTHQALADRIAARSFVASERALGEIDREWLPASKVPRLDAVIQSDPLSWHARYRRAMVRTTDFGVEPLRRALDAIYWDPSLIRFLHQSVRGSMRMAQGVRDMTHERKVGAFGYLEVLTDLRRQPHESWRDREPLAVLEALAVEVGEKHDRLPVALALCEEVLAERPEVVSVRLARAFLLVRSGRLDEADDELVVLEVWAPDTPLTWFYRALWLGRGGAEPEQIREALLRAKELGFRRPYRDRRGIARASGGLGSVQLRDYPELAPYDGRIDMDGIGVPPPQPIEKPPR